MTDRHPRPPIRGRRVYALTALAVVLSACAVAIKPDGGPPSRRTSPKGAAAVPPRATSTPTTGTTPRIIPTLMKLPVPTFDVIPPLPLAPTEIPPGTPTPAATPEAAAPVVPPPPLPPPTLRTGTARLERRGDLLVARADFLLDTGAGATFVDQRLADELALPEIIPASTEKKAAESEPGKRELIGLTVSGLGLTTEPTYAVDLGRADAPIGGPFAGVIGFPTLGPGPFTLDFTTGTLTVHDDVLFEPPPNAAAEVLRIDRGLPFVEATLENGSPVWLLLDTTAPSAVTVWRGFAKQHPGVLHGAHVPGSEASAAADTPGTEAELRSLRLLGSEHTAIPVLVQDAPMRPWERARVVGRVGMEYLRALRLTLHPTAQKIWIERP